MGLDAKHSAKHGDADLKADASEKSHKNRARKEIRKKAKLQQPSNQQASRREKRDRAGENHVSGAAECCQGRNSAGENGGGGRICGDHQVARGTENGKCQERQQEGVETGDHGRAGDLGVAECLRDIHRGKLEASQRVFDRPGTGNGPYGLQQCELVWGRRLRAHRDPDVAATQKAGGGKASTGMMQASKLRDKSSVIGKEGSNSCGNYHTRREVGNKNLWGTSERWKIPRPIGARARALDCVFGTIEARPSPGAIERATQDSRRDYFRVERGSGGTAERKAALLIELRGGIKVKSRERSDLAKPILRDVLQ